MKRGEEGKRRRERGIKRESDTWLMGWKRKRAKFEKEVLSLIIWSLSSRPSLPPLSFLFLNPASKCHGTCASPALTEANRKPSQHVSRSPPW